MPGIYKNFVRKELQHCLMVVISDTSVKLTHSSDCIIWCAHQNQSLAIFGSFAHVVAGVSASSRITTTAAAYNTG